MWPFTSRSTEDKITTEACPHKYFVDELKAFKDVGEKFNYLGQEMLVLGHKDYRMFAGGYTHIEPKLMCEYVNNNGDIKKKSFHFDMLPILIAENGEYHKI